MEKLKTKPGDVILFGAYTPHRSGPNKTKKARRMMYLTYNAKKDGDLRKCKGMQRSGVCHEKLKKIGYHGFLIGEKFMISRDPGKELKKTLENLTYEN